jgi:hypothetical protein
VGAAVVCQGCQSLVLAVWPFGGRSGFVSFSVSSGQGGRDACAVPAGSSTPSPSTQPSCSQGGRSGFGVVAGPVASLADSVASAVGCGAAASCEAAANCEAAASWGADAPGGSQPGTESPA